jgi:hypothetical protein
VFFLAPLFTTLGIILGIVAIVKKQLVWGILGIILSIIGALTSPMIMGILGMASIGAMAP